MRLLIESNGKVYMMGKTRKGLMREHRKGKCQGLCGFCFEEATEGARFKYVKY